MHSFNIRKLNLTIKPLKEAKLWLKVLIGLFAGIIVGFILGPEVNFVSRHVSEIITNWLALPGFLFLKLVKMIIIPLILSSIMTSFISNDKGDFLKKIGPRIFLYFIITTSIAIGIGLGISHLIKPGQFIDIGVLDDRLSNSPSIMADTTISAGFTKDIPSIIANILPENIMISMINGDMLGLVIFAIIVGIALLKLNRERTQSTISMLQTVQEICMTVVSWAMKLAPLAVFGLIAQLSSQMGLEIFSALGLYVITVILGLFILFVFYNLIILFLSEYSPKHFMASIKEVILLAFSTSSSAAVMPLSIKTAEDKLDVNPNIARFIIPIGATVNMDGTALYQTIATMFLAQAFGVELGLISIIMILLVTIGASIGAPAVPGVGIVILATILESVGIPTAGIALILGVDRILDMIRTSVNVTGDLTASAFFNQFAKKLLAKTSEENSSK